MVKRWDRAGQERMDSWLKCHLLKATLWFSHVIQEEHTAASDTSLSSGTGAKVNEDQK
jgi:hypothetical protein